MIRSPRLDSHQFVVAYAARQFLFKVFAPNAELLLPLVASNSGSGEGFGGIGFVCLCWWACVSVLCVCVLCVSVVQLALGSQSVSALRRGPC